MIDGGAQLPLGSEREMGGHKGYGLASMVDILCCILSGANWGPFAPPFALRQEIPARSVGKGIGHFFGALQIDGFIDKLNSRNKSTTGFTSLEKPNPPPVPTARSFPVTRKEKPKRAEVKKEFR
ncbi:MAG: Ldh family oxidoreductase [Candidatus Binatia bacterium]|nr:Ldh family oxidoreductase [Candidatus Binatia bacterium]